MPSLERFFNPQMRVFSLNFQSLPGARLYFFSTGSTTPKVTYADKQGSIQNSNPVIADSSGIFPQIFLDGIYRVELRSAQNIVQPGWPIDNVGQDTPIVPYANWVETVSYAEFERVTDPITGIVYRSKVDNNLGNVPADSPDDWQVVVDPVPSSFTSNVPYLTWSDDGGQISLDVDSDNVTVTTQPSGDSSNKAANTEFVENTITGGDQIINLGIGEGLSGGQIKLSKIGSVVTATFISVTHPSLNSTTTTAIIPASHRPSADVLVTICTSQPSASARLSTITIQSDGEINLTYEPIGAGAGTGAATGIPNTSIIYVI